jgi:hypothetical protein
MNTSLSVPSAALVAPRSRRAFRYSRFAPLAVLGVAALMAASASAIEIVAIEESWELKLGEPDAASSSPQVSMVMSPTGNLDGKFFAFTLNCHTAPDWAAGGTQVQLWDGEGLVDSHVGSNQGTLNTTNETVSWVQRTSLVDGQLVFEVVNGHSESWGDFGSEGELRVAVDSDLVNLNDYRPAISLEQSGVAFAGNRVKSLILQKLRWIDSEGHAYELNAPIDVDADLDP